MTLRATPLDQTSIQTGGRRRELAKSRLARRGYYRVSHGAGRRPPGGAKGKAGGGSNEQVERRRKSSLFRRLSSKRASAEIQQVSIRIVFIITKTICTSLFLLRWVPKQLPGSFKHGVFLQSLRLQIPMSAPVLPRGHPSPFLVTLAFGNGIDQSFALLRSAFFFLSCVVLSQALISINNISPMPDRSVFCQKSFHRFVFFSHFPLGCDFVIGVWNWIFFFVCLFARNLPFFFFSSVWKVKEVGEML